MTTYKFDHAQGGKIMGTILILLAVVVVLLFVMLFIVDDINILLIIFLLATVGTIVWIICKFYKPTFTEITFYENGIASKTHFESERLEMKDIKGIWFLRSALKDAVIENYSPDNKPSRGSMVIIGDIEYFYEAKYLRVNLVTTLHDTFSDKYTAIYYRKGLDPILDYYYNKIKTASELSD